MPGDFEAINDARMEWKNRRTNEGFHSYEQLLVEHFITALPSIDTGIYDQVIQEVFDEYKDQIFTYTRDLVQQLKGRAICFCSLWFTTGSDRAIGAAPRVP